MCQISLAPSGSLWLTGSLPGSLPGSLWPSLDLTGSLRCSPWFYVAQTLASTALALSAALCLTMAHSCSLVFYAVHDWLTRPLLGSQLCCHADTLYPGLMMASMMVVPAYPYILEYFIFVFGLCLCAKYVSVKVSGCPHIPTWPVCVCLCGSSMSRERGRGSGKQL